MTELLEALATLDADHRYCLFGDREPPKLRLDERFVWHGLPTPEPLWHAHAAACADRECDIYLSTNSYLTPLLLSIPSAAVVYDLVAFMPSAKPQLRSTLIERLTLGPTVRRASALLAISRSTADDLVERFPRAASIVRVTPLAAASGFAKPLGRDELERVRARYRLNHPFILAVGSIDPRKNLRRLVEAFRDLDPSLAERHRLVLAGPMGREAREGDETLTAVRSDAARISVLGVVPDADLAALYRLADLFCYPSLYEGFGLPVLEAMAAGACVVTSSTSSLPEVGGDAVRYIDPSSSNDIRRALSELLGDPTERARLADAARRRASAFSWTDTARLTLDALTNPPR